MGRKRAVSWRMRIAALAVLLALGARRLGVVAGAALGAAARGLPGPGRR